MIRIRGVSKPDIHRPVAIPGWRQREVVVRRGAVDGSVVRSVMLRLAVLYCGWRALAFVCEQRGANEVSASNANGERSEP